MSPPPRNMPEQEHSIKARSHELFVEPVLPGEGNRATKPFRFYLQQTPAQPISALFKAIFWMIGIVVVGLFVVAFWRITHNHKPGVPPRRAVATTAVVDPRSDVDRRARTPSPQPDGRSSRTQTTIRKPGPRK